MSYLGNTRLPREVFDKLPDDWQQMLMALNNQYNAPVELCLPLMLSVTATAVQSICDVDRWGKYRCPTSIYSMPMVDASGGKSTIFSVISDGITRYEKHLSDGWAERNRDYKVDLGRYNKALKAAENNPDDTDYKNMTEPKPVLGRSILCSKPTLNYVISMFNNVGGVFWKNEDAGEVFNSHSFNTPGKDTEFMAALSKLWSGETASREVAVVAEAASPYHRRISVGWACQEELASDLIHNPTYHKQGILNRFIFVKVEQFKKRRESIDPATRIETQNCKAIFDQFSDRIFELLKHGQQEQERKWRNEDAPLDPFELQLDLIRHCPGDGSLELHIDYHNQMLEQAEDPANENLRGFYERCSEMVARIAANIAVYEGRTSMTRGDVECAIGIVDWVKNERATMDVSKNYKVSRIVQFANDLHTWLKKYNYTAITLTKLNNNCKSIWGKMDSDEKVKVLQHLSSSGKLKPDDPTNPVTWDVLE